MIIAYSLLMVYENDDRWNGGFSESVPLNGTGTGKRAGVAGVTHYCFDTTWYRDAERWTFNQILCT